MTLPKVPKMIRKILSHITSLGERFPHWLMGDMLSAQEKYQGFKRLQDLSTLYLHTAKSKLQKERRGHISSMGTSVCVRQNFHKENLLNRLMPTLKCSELYYMSIPK